MNLSGLGRVLTRDNNVGKLHELNPKDSAAIKEFAGAKETLLDGLRDKGVDLSGYKYRLDQDLTGKSETFKSGSVVNLDPGWDRAFEAIQNHAPQADWQILPFGGKPKADILAAALKENNSTLGSQKVSLGANGSLLMEF